MNLFSPILKIATFALILKHLNLSYLMSAKSKLLSLTRQKIEGIIFFILFYLYLWLEVDLRLVPNAGGGITKFPVFYLGWDFFSNTCAMPGGPVDYLSSFLVQFFYISWAGAIVVTLQAWLIYFFTRKFLDRLKITRFSYVSFTGPIIILALYYKYIYFFNITSGLLVALVFAYVYAVLVEKKKRANTLFVFLILSLVLYPIAGGSLLMFGLLCMIYEMIGRSRLIVAGAELALAFAVAFVVGVGIYDIGTIEAFTRLLPINTNLTYIILENTKRTSIACSLYLFLPLISLFLWLFQKIPAPDFLHSNRYRRIVFHMADGQFLILLILTSLAVCFTYDKTKKNCYTADYYANQRNWSKALEAAELDIDYPWMLCIVNRALHHQGRLPQDMFLYPQQRDALFYPLYAPLDDFRGLYQGTDLCIDLGLISHAERYAWQKIEVFGPLPELLKRLAIIKMAKGNMDAARVYLKTLGKTLFHTDWSREYLAKLEADPNLSTDKYIQYLRGNMLKNDHCLGKGVDLWTLIKLLEENRYNKMAFEYLMTMYLLNRQPEGIVKNLHRLPDFDYTETPAAYQEAYFLCMVWGRKVKSPNRFKVSEESKQRFDELDKFMRKYGADQYALEREMTTTFRNTYYEYCYYGYKYNLGSTGEKK